MAIEPKRGCGFRTVGGLYIVCDGVAFACDRLTFEIAEVCPCCGNGTKFSRGWTWVDPVKFFGGDHLLAFKTLPHNDPEVAAALPDPQIATKMPCDCLGGRCPVCRPDRMGDRAAILWIGDRHYTVEEFKAEAASIGISRKIAGVPRNLELGKTWVLCAHLKAITRTEVVPDPGEDGEDFETKHFPGVFFAFRPTRIEKIVKQSDLDLFQRVEFMSEDEREKWLSGSGRSIGATILDRLRPGTIEKEIEAYKSMKRDADRGITFVPVPDDDPDHNPEVRK